MQLKKRMDGERRGVNQKVNIQCKYTIRVKLQTPSCLRHPFGFFRFQSISRTLLSCIIFFWVVHHFYIILIFKYKFRKGNWEKGKRSFKKRVMPVKGKEKNGYYLIDVGENFNTRSLIDIRKFIDTALESGFTHIVFNVEKCQHMDSSAIGLLGNLHKKIAPESIKISLLKPLPAIMDLISITHISTFIHTYNSEEEITP
jgi:anti-anti-sigma factor